MVNMPAWLDKIGFRLILAVGVTAILIIGVFSYFNIRSHTEVLLAEVERRANQLSETVKYSTRHDMLFNQRERIHRQIRDIGEQPGINRIRLLNKTGEIVYSSKPDDIGKMVDKNAESCFVCHSDQKPIERLTISERTRIFRLHPDSVRIMGIINPIYNEASCWEASCHVHEPEQKVLGVLDVTIPLADVDAQVQSSRLEMTIFALVSFVALSCIIGVFVYRWVEIPVHTMVTATHEIAGGNLNHALPENRSDELGQLARAFNHMTRKMAEARLQLFQSDKMASLGRLAAGVAHEINNPLTGVLTYSSYLMKRTASQPDIQEDLKVIVRETLRSREIVKSLLDFARQSVPKKSAADICEIIRRSLSVTENQLRLHRVKVETNFNEDMPHVIVDSNQMQQVFINLLVNAADAMSESGGTIHIHLARINLSPYGTTQIRKALCNKNHNLMSPDIKINGLPTIRLKAKSEGAEGFLYLDPIYGSHQHEYGILSGNILSLQCPQCLTSVINESVRCPKCNALTYSFEVSGKGVFRGCTRSGCDWQQWPIMDEAGVREFVEIKVCDNGVGIPPEDMSRIFEPFFTTKGQKGTGLGLSVIWGIIDNHDGKITVESIPGQGTTFTIRIPVKS